MKIWSKGDGWRWGWFKLAPANGLETILLHLKIFWNPSIPLTKPILAFSWQGCQTEKGKNTRRKNNIETGSLHFSFSMRLDAVGTFCNAWRLHYLKNSHAGKKKKHSHIFPYHSHGLILFHNIPTSKASQARLTWKFLLQKKSFQNQGVLETPFDRAQPSIYWSLTSGSTTMLVCFSWSPCWLGSRVTVIQV